MTFKKSFPYESALYWSIQVRERNDGFISSAHPNHIPNDADVVKQVLCAFPYDEGRDGLIP
jgi:hypothetical protein